MSSQPALDPGHGVTTAERILLAAADLFAVRGYDAVSISEIARHSGVSKACVFHHYNNKNELYLAVVRRACARSSERLAGLGETRDSLPERFSAFANGMLTDMFDQAQVTRIILRELLLEGEQRGPELAERVFGDNFAALVNVLRDGQKQGALRADADPAMIATLLIGANVFFFEARDVLKHFRDVSFANDPDTYSRLVADIILRGIAAAPNETNKN